MIPRLKKRPDETRLLEVEVGPIMRAADTIDTVTGITASDALTVDEISHTDTVVTFRVAGGLAGVLYPMRVAFDTVQSPAQSLEALVDLHVLAG